ncbi:hypothetical protein PINS_up006764 [Pythium insidiosum]|nr:hypothetical protein PINS_up006764 [Pythium insidiosum]
MLNNGTGATGAPGGGALVSAREQYLMNELFKVQNELDSIKKERKKMERRQKGRDKDKAQLKGGSKSPVQNARGGESDSDSSDSSSERSKSTESSEDSSDSERSESEVDRKNDSVTRAASPLESQVPSVDSHEAKPVDVAAHPDSEEREEAVKVIQSRSKGFLVRRNFVKKKRAADRIKAQYRGYLVRKHMELLDRSSHNPTVVSLETQVKMQIVRPHYEFETKTGSHGSPLRVILRVSKDPPILHITLSADDSNSAMPSESTDDSLESSSRRSSMMPALPCAFFFHLFESVALLPLHDETKLLERATESEIARVIGAHLQVVNSSMEYRFLVNRRHRSSEGNAFEVATVPAITGSYLTPLDVLKADEGVHKLPPCGDIDVGCSTAVPLDDEDDDDLDTLIRLSRTPSSSLEDVVLASPSVSAAPTAPNSSATTGLSSAGDIEIPANVRLDRRRSSSLDSIPEN